MEQEFVIRPVRLDDIGWFRSIAHMFDAGLTSMPNNEDFLHKRLTIVDKSFKEEIPVHERVYLFVRENLPQKELIGLSGIDVDIGHKESFYNYQISTVTQSNEKLDIYMMHTLLNVVNNFQNASEIISFWVHPDHRGHRVGKSLSLSRFLFIAQFTNWFGKEIIAELRGVLDKSGQSPFWDAVGKKFFDMEFKRADSLTMTAGKQFIADLISHEPIYLDLLSPEAQKVVGVEHPDAAPVRHLLQEQGFKFSNHVDIFDAGPVLSADKDKIKVIANNKVVTINKIQDKLEEAVTCMMYNNRIDARITVAKIQLLGDNGAIITQRVAEILEVKAGDQLRYTHL